MSVPSSGRRISPYAWFLLVLTGLHRLWRFAFAVGTLNTATGVEATPDALYQIGSITKVWTATLLMLQIGRGRLTLDTRVAEVLPEFKVADPEVTKTVTIRHLLSHTSGIDGDVFLDTGRGDDCLEKHVEACADLRHNHPLGATQSSCNSGSVIAGRVLERLAGKRWDDVLWDDRPVRLRPRARSCRAAWAGRWGSGRWWF